MTPCTVAYQAPLSMKFSRQEYQSELPFPSPGDLPHPGIEPRSPALQADSLLSEPPGKPRNELGVSQRVEIRGNASLQLGCINSDIHLVNLNIGSRQLMTLW